MASVKQQVLNADAVIYRNIEMHAEDPGFLAQNILAQFRNLVEGLIIWMHKMDEDHLFSYPQLDKSLRYTRRKQNIYRDVNKLHDALQHSTSHFTLDGDSSQRLMAKYVALLIKVRAVAEDKLAIEILRNIHEFPLNTDPELYKYYERISERIQARRQQPLTHLTTGHYYIHSSRPFLVRGSIFYEVTFYPAHDRTTKSDRQIGFTNIDLTTNYAANLGFVADEIDIFDSTMPILIIRTWEVSIRPCEIDNFRRYFGEIGSKTTRRSTEYLRLMSVLSSTKLNLVDLIDLDDNTYNTLRSQVTATTKGEVVIFAALDEARQVISADAPGARILRYLLRIMRNRTIKDQFQAQPNPRLSNLRLSWKCIPFDTMPLCTSPPNHIPAASDLIETFDIKNRPHELLARRVKNNVELNGNIYTPVSELEDLGETDELIKEFNNKVYYAHRNAGRELVKAQGHVFLKTYEDTTYNIITELQSRCAAGIPKHTEDVESWLQQNPAKIDDDNKALILAKLFADSHAAVIYGAAGTGKSTMVSHIAQYFASSEKLFIAHTNAAVENLRNRVKVSNSCFQTITSHLSNKWKGTYDLLVIDESSVVSNANMLKILRETSFKYLVLVGDDYQLESIEFGNWFKTIRSYIPKTAAFELTQLHRTQRPELQKFWDEVRRVDDHISESIARNGLAHNLDEELFVQNSSDEIVLCLNYDGLYGINNLNRILQLQNPNSAVEYRGMIYKKGDPVIFAHTDRLGAVAYNNTKGEILDTLITEDRIIFDIKLHDTDIPDNLSNPNFEVLDSCSIRFHVLNHLDTDADDSSEEAVIPFQVAYAVAIHKAQGLEYDSVKIVVTEVNKDDITPSIFYTAITRSKNHLKIFWTESVQEHVLDELKRMSSLDIKRIAKNENLLRERRKLVPA